MNMRCELCWKATQCSCRGGGCKVCHSTNKQISVMNDLLKFWLSKDKLRESLNTAHQYTDKIDNYTLYEYLNWDIEQTAFEEAVQNYLPIKQPVKTMRKSEVIDTTGRINPGEECVFEGTSPWDRCIYCWSVRRYVKGQRCLRFGIEEEKVEEVKEVKEEIKEEAPVVEETKEEWIIDKVGEIVKKKRTRKKKTEEVSK